jgi:hypothetical protein
MLVARFIDLVQERIDALDGANDLAAARDLDGRREGLLPLATNTWS